MGFRVIKGYVPSTPFLKKETPATCGVVRALFCCHFLHKNALEF